MSNLALTGRWRRHDARSDFQRAFDGICLRIAEMQDFKV